MSDMCCRTVRGCFCGMKESDWNSVAGLCLTFLLPGPKMADGPLRPTSVHNPPKPYELTSTAVLPLLRSMAGQPRVWRLTADSTLGHASIEGTF